MKTIKIKLLRGINTVSPQVNSDWIDLRAAVEVKLGAGEYKAIPLGAAIELPKGYEAIVAPRSSTRLKPNPDKMPPKTAAKIPSTLIAGKNDSVILRKKDTKKVAAAVFTIKPPPNFLYCNIISGMLSKNKTVPEDIPSNR